MSENIFKKLAMYFKLEINVVSYSLSKYQELDYIPEKYRILEAFFLGSMMSWCLKNSEFNSDVFFNKICRYLDYLNIKKAHEYHSNVLSRY